MLGAGCDFESWMTVVKRCELCMGYVGMFSPKDGKSHTYHASVYSFRVVHDPLWIKICYVMKTQSGSPLLYIDDAAVSSPISMEHVQNACWLCDPFRDDGFFFMDDDRCGLMVCFWMCGPLKK